MITAKVTPAQYEGLKETLAGEGVELGANGGVIEKEGIRAGVRYDGAANLTVEITHKPWELSMALVEGKIADGLRQKGLDCKVTG